MSTEDIAKRWYSVTSYGAATLCVSEQDARDVAATCDRQWPQDGPHRAVQLVDADALAALEARAAAAENLAAGRLELIESDRRNALKIRDERDALRARLAEIEAQEPFGTVTQKSGLAEGQFFVQWTKLPAIGTKLYARPVPAARISKTYAGTDA